MTTATVATTPTAEPTPVPVTTTLPPPPATTLPAGHRFDLTKKIDVGLQVGPVTLVGVVFKTTRPDELEAQLEFVCAKGKDQMVTFELVVRDAAGAALVTVKGKKGVEEKERASAKHKEHGWPGLLRECAVVHRHVPERSRLGPSPYWIADVQFSTTVAGCMASRPRGERTRKRCPSGVGR